MIKQPIALQVYSVRDDAAADFRGTMQAIKEMGYQGVELAGTYDMTVAQAKEILDEVGLEFVSAHVTVEELEVDEILDEYAAAGLKYIAVPYISGFRDEEMMLATIDKIRKIAVRTKARGMQLLYHNHDFEFKKINGRYVLDAIYEEIPEDLLKTELDTCWVNVGGEDPAQYVLKYSGRAPIVHLKDFFGVKNDHMYALIGLTTDNGEAQEFELRPVGYGVQNFPAIVDAADRADAKWLIVEQDRPSLGKTPMECARMSMEYLKTL